MPVTLNPSDKHADSTLSNGDLTVDNDGAGPDFSAVRATISKSTGKWYFEVVIDAQPTNSIMTGWINAAHSLNEGVGRDAAQDGWGYHFSAGRDYYKTAYDTMTGGAAVTNDIIGVAVDFDAQKLWYAKNNTWLESGNPAGGTGAQRTNFTGTLFPAVSTFSSDQTASIIFIEDDWNYSAPTGFDSLDQNKVEDEIGIADAVDVSPEYAPIVADEIGITDTITASGGTTYATSPDTIGIADQISGNIEIELQPITDGFRIGDIVDASIFPGRFTDGIGINDEVKASFEYIATSADGLGISDLVEGLNWTQWIRENGDLAIKRYLFTLTGDPDNTTDFEIPISSFQARKRTGYDTYFSVNIPGFTYATQITNRANAEMVLDLGYEIDGSIALREEILRVDLTKINIYEGARRRAYQLIGYKTHNFANQIAVLENANYRSTDDGRILYRFPHVDPYVNPGDTCRIRNDEFTIDYITFTVSERSSTMEIREI